MRIPGIEPPLLSVKTFRRKDTEWLSKLHAQSPALLELLPGRFEPASQEDRRRMVREALAKVSPGAVVATVARCCEHGQELAQRLVESGIPPQDLNLVNLSNKDIVTLRPHYACFLTRAVEYRSSRWQHYPNPSEAFSRDLLGVSDLPAVNCELPDRFRVTSFQVGLVWKKA